MRRRSRFAVLLWLSLLPVVSCGECARFASCRLRRDFASCQRGPDCQPFDRCAPGGGPGRCSPACKVLGASCGLSSAAQSDGCLTDMRAGHEGTCIATDRNPNRCQPGRDAKGHPTCTDTDLPCAGCQMVFDSCEARNHCNGVLCF